ncbi:MAG: hypothetical protein NTY69_02010 [Methylococcales bacterium]|nr:hypothetical protein [Methylococcales bacterium]
MKADQVNKTIENVKASLPLISQITGIISPRMSETSTHLGGAVLAIGSPQIIQQIMTAIALGIAGDYIGCATNAIPILLGVAAAVKAIITPENKGLTDDEIKSAVSAMSGDDLIKLLRAAN